MYGYNKKAIYVLSDFVKNFIPLVGDMPDEKDEAIKWYRNVLMEEYAIFRDKYKNTTIDVYQKDILMSYMDLVEREYKSKFEDGNT